MLYKDSGKTEYFSRQKNLRGTCRSLDGTFGRTVLDKGFITENGLYLFDDSKSVLLDDNGKFIVKKKKCKIGMFLLMVRIIVKQYVTFIK